MAAIRALEARSREFMKEKLEKRELEKRIGQLEGQVLIGGETEPRIELAGVRQFINALPPLQEMKALKTRLPSVKQ